METAKAYRERAQAVRAVAESMVPSLRKVMLDLAAQWEALARQSEYLAQVRTDLANL